MPLAGAILIPSDLPFQPPILSAPIEDIALATNSEAAPSLRQDPADKRSRALGASPEEPSVFRSLAVSLFAGTLVFLGLILWLRILGRPWICPCGSVEIWQGALTEAENSQQFSDWYSGLHVIFGMALFGFVAVMAPRWPLAKRAVLAVLSSAAWEAMENTPLLIATFSRSPNSPDYFGDSILNASGDTLFVLAGFFIAAKLPAWATLVLAVALDLTIELVIGDGFVLGTLKLFQG